MQALILAGGSGTRFWPLSRLRRPKQLLALDGDTSLLRRTVERLSPLVAPAAVWVCTTRDLVDAVRADLPQVPSAQILAEPCGRNTAAAIGWSLAAMPAPLRGGVVAVLPADHRFGDDDAFRAVLARAAAVAESHDRVVALGVTPRWAETGYGYLEIGEPLDGDPDGGVHGVVRFIEKPDLATAAAYLGSGRHLWNAGIFVFRGATLLAHLARFEPELARGLAAIAAAPERTAELYPTLPATSIDYAVMERLAGEIAAVALDAGWSDLGSWEALTEVLPADEHGNRVRGDVVAIDAGDNLLWADRGTVAAIGVENLVVVRTGDSVLVMPRERSQDVKLLVEALRAGRRDELL